MGVERLRIHTEDEGRLREGVEAVAIRVEADLGVVCEVLLEAELARHVLEDSLARIGMSPCAEVVDHDPLGFGIPQVTPALEELVLVRDFALLEVESV